ncbi:MAG TPA: hypothetical protein VKE95_19500, partial [Burkholderiales bacterium]|nr:hypothetical protein [Burkholderiales bacterium]
MTAVAEKQVKSALPQRRAATRAVIAFSRMPAPAPQHSVLREIVGVPQVQKACAGCSDEIRVERLALEPAEDEHEERVQREGEPHAFAAAAAGEDEDERRPHRRVPAARPGAPISVGPADDEHEREADAVADRLGRAAPAPAAPPAPKRDEDEARKKALRGKRGGAGREGGEIDDAQLAARLDSPSGGRPLSAALRESVAPLLPYDFSEVRVHDS